MPKIVVIEGVAIPRSRVCDRGILVAAETNFSAETSAVFESVRGRPRRHGSARLPNDLRTAVVPPVVQAKLPDAERQPGAEEARST